MFIIQFYRFVYFTIKHSWLIIIIYTEWVIIKNIIIQFRILIKSLWFFSYYGRCIGIKNYFRILFNFWLNVRKKQKFFEIIRNQMISFCVKLFSFLCRKFIRDFRRLVKIFERTTTKWFQFIRQMSSFWKSMKKITSIVSGLFRLGEFCIVYARAFFSVRFDINLN